MQYKKLFYPVAGGDELKERLYGALSIVKYFKCHLEVMKSTPGIKGYNHLMMPENIVDDIDAAIVTKYAEENKNFKNTIEEIAKEIDVAITDKKLEEKGSIELLYKSGSRSVMAAQESKYADCVIIAAPPNGNSTATFEAVVMHSGKPVLMFPRVMRSFSTKSVLIGWDNSPEVSKALTLSIPILQEAERVHIVTAEQYVPNLKELERLQDYLRSYDIETTTGMITTTLFAGEAILDAAKKGNFDLIVAGAYRPNGLKELMFGALTKYLLTHTHIPVFMAN
ncbi:universal stress protein [Sulfurospirillum arcachonense]|uniref:universal stress protein n=1 Tax=Sulfurospirillum arcachonense TaxID=57666 RepID=UPI0004683FAF|nr:universal stress protein [Sulfurospirillum arcachonense]